MADFPPSSRTRTRKPSTTPRGLGSSTGAIAQNWLNLAAERGLSSFDQRHLFTAALQYSTGVGVHGGALLSGWRGRHPQGVDLPIQHYRRQRHAVLTGLLSDDAAYRHLRHAPAGVRRWRHLRLGTAGASSMPAAYAAPPAGQWGDAARNSIIGPNQFSMNGSMARSFQDKYTVTFAGYQRAQPPDFPGWNSTFNPNFANGGPFGTPAAGRNAYYIRHLPMDFLNMRKIPFALLLSILAARPCCRNRNRNRRIPSRQSSPPPDRQFRSTSIP